MLACKPLKAWITLCEAFFVSAKTTPTPWVPSKSLMTNGGPPTSFIKSSVSSGECAKPVIGIPTFSFAISWRERSLSLERVIAIEGLIE